MAYIFCFWSDESEKLQTLEATSEMVMLVKKMLLGSDAENILHQRREIESLSNWQMQNRLYLTSAHTTQFLFI